MLRNLGKMKRLTFILIWMATMAIPAMADGTLTFNSIECEKEQPGATSHMTVEFPTGDDSPLRRAIIDYIYQNLRTMGNLTIHLEEGPLAPADKHVHFPSNTCDETVFKTFLEEVTTIVCKQASDDQQEYAKSLAEDGETYEVKWFDNRFIGIKAETDTYVSCVTYWGEFCGGAHDSRGSNATTIRKSDGKPITPIFKEDVEEAMQPLLWKYLIISENPDNPEEYRAEIKKFLKANYGNSERLFLPEGTSYLAPDGVHILYQPLEICFWPDEPEIIIPFSASKPFLTKEAIETAGL